MDTQFEDLKQFVAATVAQTEERLSAQIEALGSDMDAGFAGVAEAIEGQNQHIDGRDREVDQHLARLDAVVGK
jgi:hypothetical protein